MNTEQLREAAFAYAANGWCVFPVRYKQPLVRWRDESTSDTESVLAFDWSSATGIGLDCGKSGIVVLDIDRLEAIPVLADAIGWDPTDDDTYVCDTGGGGIHVYYSAGATGVRNSASKVVSGIDVRGDGGYVVLPQSAHESGRTYEWRRTPTESIRPIPEKLVEVLNYREERPAPQPQVNTGRTYEKWGLAVLAEEAAIIEAAAAGTRNSTLFEHAGYVYEVVKGGHLDRGIADMRLQQAAERVGLDAHETRATLDSAWQRALPRDPVQKEPPAPKPQRQDRKRGFRVLGVDDLSNLPPPQWLLPHRLPEGQTWMYGEAGVGKTFLALDWACTVAASGLGVLYFVGEGLQGFGQRVLSWRAAHGADISTFRAIPQVPHLLDRESIEDLEATVGHYQPALIVIDTFARASVGGDENSARDMGLAIDALDMMWREYKASSLVLHHANKSGGGERGSSAIRGAADATWEVQAGINGDKLVGFQAVCRKMKDAEPPGPALFQLRQSGDSAIIYPSALT